MLYYSGGTHLRTGCTDRTAPSTSARERYADELAGAERDSLRRREWVQVARLAKTVRQLAHDLRAAESVGQEWYARTRVRAPATGAIIRLKIEAMSLDSTAVKVHPDGTGALKKTGRKPSESPEADGQPKFIWLPRMLERP